MGRGQLKVTLMTILAKLIHFTNEETETLNLKATCLTYYNQEKQGLNQLFQCHSSHYIHCVAIVWTE